MTDPSGPPYKREQQVDALIAQYYEQLEQGRPADPSAFLAAHPEYTVELKEFLADLGLLNDVVRPPTSDLPATQFPPVLNATAPGPVIRYFGEYELLEELGSGGMGVVYKARQKKLKRIVALKLIKSGEFANPQDLQRFQAEAQAAARLSHPNIVPVHEVGVDQGQHFYTMDYVAGANLSKLHRDEPVPSRRAAELIEQLARAMQYAHGQGVVHRDLKPANILLTPDGTPRITDFGLAKVLRSDEDTQAVTLTETGQILGTAGYMSPEQAAGKTRLVGPSADIYALGAILYALLTGRAPFVGETVSHTILQVLHKDPVSPRILNPGVPRDLETICLKCLEKEPHKRYGTAQLLADDLQRFLEGRPVLALPLTPLGRGWRWCRRNPVVAALLATVAASLVSGTAISWTFANQAQRRADDNLKLASSERDARHLAELLKEDADRLRTLAESRRKEAETNAALAETRRQQADEHALSAQQHLYVSTLKRAQKAWDEGHIRELLLLLDQCRPQTEEVDLRSFEWDYWQQRCQGGLLTLRGTDATFRNHGNEIVTLSKGIQVYHAATGELVRTVDFPAGSLPGFHPVIDAGATLLASRIYVSNRDSPSVILTDIATGQLRHRLAHPQQVQDADFRGDGQRLATSCLDGLVRIWNTQTGTLESQLDVVTAQDRQRKRVQPPGPVAFRSDGHLLAYVQGNSLKLWNGKSESAPVPVVGFHDSVNQLGFSPDGRMIAGGNLDGRLVIWDVERRQTQQVWQGHADAISALAFSPDGHRLAVASNDMTVTLWDVATTHRIATFKGHRTVVRRLQFSPDGTRLLSSASGPNSGETHATRVWDTVAHEETPSLIGAPLAIVSMNLSPDGKRLLACDWGGDTALWNLADGSSTPRRQIPGGGVYEHYRTRFDPTGERAIGYSGYGYGVWNVNTGQMEVPLIGLKYQSVCNLFSPDGSLAVGASQDGAVMVWDARSGALQREFKEHRGTVIDAVFSHDGQRLMTADNDGSVLIWEVATGLVKQRQLMEDEDRSGVTRLQLSSSGKLLAIARENGTVTLLDPDTGTPWKTLVVNPEGSVTDLAFSPDGKRLATAGGDYGNGRARLWDLQTGEDVLTLESTSPVISVVFLRTGNTLVTGHKEGTIRFWEAEPSSRRARLVQPVPTLASTTPFGDSPEFGTVMHSPDGTRALTGGKDGLVRLWDLQTHSAEQMFHGHEGAVRTVAFSPVGTVIASGGDDRTVRFWDVATAMQRGRIDTEGVCTRVRFSTDGQQVFTISSGGKLRVIDLATSTVKSERAFGVGLTDFAMYRNFDQAIITGTADGQLLMSELTFDSTYGMDGHPGGVKGLELVGPEVARQVLSCGSDHLIRLSSLGIDRPEKVFRGHLAAVNEVRRHPDGRRFVSVSDDHTLRLWDLASGQELARGTVNSELRSVSVAPDGLSCLTVCTNGTLLRWALPSAISHLRFLLQRDPQNVDLQKRLKYAELREAQPFAPVFSQLTSEQYQWDVDVAIQRHLRPSKLTLEVKDGVVLHGGEFIPSKKQRWQARHGQSKTQHEQTHAKLTAEGLTLDCHAVVMVKGQEVHAAVWISKPTSPETTPSERIKSPSAGTR